MVQAAFALILMNDIQSFTPSSSFYTKRLDDPAAVYLETFAPKGDGIADDTQAIQKAINQVQEAGGEGIVFVPSGRYRLTETLTVWPGVRIIGVGSTRPVFVLRDNTPGFDKIEKFMVFFAGGRPRGQEKAVPRTQEQNGLEFHEPNEANPGTFYSAVSNIDLEIGRGNDAAVGVRGRYAQHCHLSHMDFRLQSGLAAIHDTGGFAEDLRIIGGEFGIITRTPSPGWQFTMMDSQFAGQKKAAIRTQATGLTLIGITFRDAPTAIAVEPEKSEQLWLQDSVMENISGPALLISKEQSQRTQINVQNLLCRDTPILAKFRESGRVIKGKGRLYRAASLTHGSLFKDQASDPVTATQSDIQEQSSADIAQPIFASPRLPVQESWVDVHSLGVKGDGETDDTEAIRRAVSQADALYFPSGKYLISDTISLNSQTSLIGLNPITTQIIVKDGTAAFRSSGSGRAVPFGGQVKPLIYAPPGGACKVSGIGLDAGGNNPSACGALWRAGEDSLMEDVKFLGGHGSGVPWGQLYNSTNTADGKPGRYWDSQYPSLWVTQGGGGVFKDIWTASPYAQAGMMISDTETPGRVYQMSSEHHVRYEVQVRNASNWELVSLQTEEERGEGPFALPLEIVNSKNILVANLNMYRVVSVTQPFISAIKTQNSHGVSFRGVHCYSNSKASFDNALIDEPSGAQVRQREFAALNLVQKPEKPLPSKVTKLASGFFNISGGVVDSRGRPYFVDAKWQRIYRWNESLGVAEVIQDSPLLPVNLAIDSSDNLMVVSYGGNGVVYAFHPDHPDKITLIQPTAALPNGGLVQWLPVTDWGLAEDLLRGLKVKRPWRYVSPDGTCCISASQDFVDGSLSWGVKLTDLIRSFGLAKATPGKPHYLSGESSVHTYRLDVTSDGGLDKGALFAEQGGEGAAEGPDGRIYLAAGQVFIYSPKGALVETIRVPERPTQLLFGGKDGRTLYIAARTSLYSVRI